MKLTRQSVLAASTLIIGGFIGASALVALADWTAPTTPAPGCPSGSPGCDSPINAGPTAQTKQGILGAVGLVTNSLTVNSGSVTSSSTVLLNNGSGVGSWGPATAQIIKATGTVNWVEGVSMSAKAATLKCGATSGDGVCNADADALNNVTSISCKSGNILDTISSVTNQPITETFYTYHKGYCVTVAYP